MAEPARQQRARADEKLIEVRRLKKTFKTGLFRRKGFQKIAKAYFDEIEGSE